MPKYRITNTVSNELKNTIFTIERKGTFRWKSIEIRENGESKILSFQSYVEAEHYLIKNYCRGQGELYQPRPNEYHYYKYSYYV